MLHGWVTSKEKMYVARFSSRLYAWNENEARNEKILIQEKIHEAVKSSTTRDTVDSPGELIRK